MGVDQEDIRSDKSSAVEACPLPSSGPFPAARGGMAGSPWSVTGLSVVTAVVVIEAAVAIVQVVVRRRRCWRTRHREPHSHRPVPFHIPFRVAKRTRPWLAVDLERAYNVLGPGCRVPVGPFRGNCPFSSAVDKLSIKAIRRNVRW